MVPTEFVLTPCLLRPSGPPVQLCCAGAVVDWTGLNWTGPGHTCTDMHTVSQGGGGLPVIFSLYYCRKSHHDVPDESINRDSFTPVALVTLNLYLCVPTNPPGCV